MLMWLAIHNVPHRSLTKLANDGLLHLDCADDNAVTWLRDVTMKALTI